MQKCEYVEGRTATENFEGGMKALFKVSKGASQTKKRTQPKSASVRKTKRSDKD